MMNPSLQAFTAWIYGVMGVPLSALPEDSMVIPLVYEETREWLAPLSPYFSESPATWRVLFFNLGGHFLIGQAPDVEGSYFFEGKREEFNFYNTTAGVVSSTSDESTSVSMVVSPAMANLTLGNLEMMKDPYGKKALSILMELGPLWGIS